MLNNEIDLVLSSKSGMWDDKIAFSLNIYYVNKYCREGMLQVFKIGRHSGRLKEPLEIQ